MLIYLKENQVITLMKLLMQFVYLADTICLYMPIEYMYCDLL